MEEKKIKLEQESKEDVSRCQTCPFMQQQNFCMMQGMYQQQMQQPMGYPTNRDDDDEDGHDDFDDFNRDSHHNHHGTRRFWRRRRYPYGYYPYMYGSMPFRSGEDTDNDENLQGIDNDTDAINQASDFGEDADGFRQYPIYPGYGYPVAPGYGYGYPVVPGYGYPGYGYPGYGWGGHGWGGHGWGGHGGHGWGGHGGHRD